MEPSSLHPSAAAAAEYAYGTTRNATRVGASVEAASGLFRKIALFADECIQDAQKASPEKVDCKPGCFHCCHRQVIVLVPELYSVLQFVRENFSPEDVAALTTRLQAYEAQVAEAQRLGDDPTRITCPLLDKGLCSVYQARPMSCRGINSFDVESCRESYEEPETGTLVPGLRDQAQIAQMSIQGMQRALTEARGPMAVANLGLAMAKLMLFPNLAEQVLERRAPLPPPVEPVAPTKFAIDNDGVHGQNRDQAIPAARSLIERGEMARAESLLKPDEPTHLLAKLWLPASYASNDEMLEARARYQKLLEQLLDTRFDARSMFNALSGHQTFNLAYQGLSVKEILAKHGTLLVDRIAKVALPHLSAPIEGARKPGRLRLGYIGANIRNSNGGKWALGWLENHGDGIETYSINLSERDDPVSMRFKANSNHYYRLQGDVQAAAEFVRSLDLDVLIYTDLGMDGRNYQYACLRLARMQCTAWGHPVTSGLPTIDCYLSSELMEPEGAESEYTEKLVKLPRSGLCYKRYRVALSTKTAGDFGIPEDTFLLMGQKLAKWTPSRDPLLAEIGSRTKKPIVFVGQDAPFAARMKKLGIRHVMLPQVTLFEYDRLLELAEVSIDPPDWSGGNTTIAALNLRTPVVTLPGPYMRGRHSLAFNTLAGVEKLIARDERDLVDLAVNAERRTAAMKNAHPEVLYDDKAVVKALDEFLLA